MTLRRPLLWCVPVVVLFSALRPTPAQAPTDALGRIEAKNCQKQSGSILASFRLENALGAEERTSLEGGIPVTFVHHVSVWKRRALFFDKVLARKTIEVTATFDTLTKQYALTRKIDGVDAGQTSTDTYPAVERWLCEVKALEIPLPEGELAGNLELRVKSAYRHIYAVYLFPRDLTAEDDTGCHP